MRLVAFLLDDSAATRRRCAVALLVLTALSFAAQWAVCPVPLTVSANDFIGFIDAGYRVVSGQVPHNDFSTQFGPAFSYVYAIGVRLFGPTVRAVAGANLLMMLVATPLAWFFSVRRLSPVLALVFSATVMTTASGVAPLGWSIHATDYAMSYNRYACGFLMCVCVASFFPPRDAARGAAGIVEEACLGALVSFLLLFKLNFFVVAACAVAARPFFTGLDARKLAWTAGGFLAPVLFVWLALGVRPGAFLGDMSYLLAIARETRPSLLGPVGELAARLPIPILTALAAIAAGGWWCVARRRRVDRSLARSAAAAAFLLAADLAIGVSNTQPPVLVFLPFVTLVVLRELLASDARGSRVLPALVVATLTLSATTVLRETASTAIACRGKLALDPTDVGDQRIDVPGLGDVYIPSAKGDWSEYPWFLNDGMRLLERHVAPGATIVTLNLVNPFDFAFGLTPARGTQVFWWYPASYSRKNHLPPQRVFSGADLVIVDRLSFRLIPDYRSYLASRFDVVDHGRAWTLYKRAGGR